MGVGCVCALGTRRHIRGQDRLSGRLPGCDDLSGVTGFGKRIDERWNLWGSYAFERRAAAPAGVKYPGISNDAFSQDGHTLTANVEYTVSERVSVNAGSSLRYGDVVSTTSAGGYLYASSKAIADDPTFGPYEYAYRLNGTTWLLKTWRGLFAHHAQFDRVRLPAIRDACSRRQQLRQFDARNHLELSLLMHKILAMVALLACAAPHAAELQVRVTDHKGELVADAVILAVPLDPKNAQRGKLAGDAVDQVDKQFVPYVKPVLVGATVRFRTATTFDTRCIPSPRPRSSSCPCTAERMRRPSFSTSPGWWSWGATFTIG